MSFLSKQMKLPPRAPAAGAAGDTLADVVQQQELPHDVDQAVLELEGEQQSQQVEQPITARTEEQEDPFNVPYSEFEDPLSMKHQYRSLLRQATGREAPTVDEPSHPLSETEQPQQQAQPIDEASEPKPSLEVHDTLGEAVRHRTQAPEPKESVAKVAARDARDSGIEDAAMYAELRPDAIKHAKESKDAWSKVSGKLDRVKEDHQEFRQEHKLTSWLHDKGIWKSDKLQHHQDREQRYVEREAKAYNTHVSASDEVQRLDTNLAQAQEQARTGWSQMDAIHQAEQKQKQSTGGGSRGPEQTAQQESPQRAYQNHEALTHTAGTAALAGGKQDAADAPEVDRFSGALVKCGPAPYLNDPKNSGSYFVTLRNDDGKESTHWGKDLGRAMDEVGARTGDRIQLARTGEDKNVEVQESVKNEHGQVIGTKETQAVRRGWSATRQGDQPQPAPEQMPEPPKFQPRTLSAAVTAQQPSQPQRKSPFADLDAPDANQPSADLHPEVPGQRRRIRP